MQEYALDHRRTVALTLPEIRSTWERQDILALLVDMNHPPHPCSNHISGMEEDAAVRQLSAPFQKRFRLSRTLLKILFGEIWDIPSLSEISFPPYDRKRVRVNEGDFPWICLSYSQHWLMLVLGKRPVAGDIEVIRPCPVSPSRYPAFHRLDGDVCRKDPSIYWHQWTRVEAATKLLDIPLMQTLGNISVGEGLLFDSSILNKVLMCTLCAHPPDPRTGIFSWVPEPGSDPWISACG